MLGPKARPSPGPSYMSEDQKAQYLQSLRNTNSSRPTGSRPPPASKFASPRRTETNPNVTTSTEPERPALVPSNSMPTMSTQSLSHRRTESDLMAKSPFLRRQIVRPSSATPSVESQPEQEQAVQRRPSIPYMERGTRWMEKQEARSVRMALEDMDLEEEQRIHSAAQDEAAELVWQHRNPTAAKAAAEAPYPNPDIRRDYRQHLRKGSYQRSHSREAVPMVAQRSASEGSQSSQSDSGGSMSSKRKSVGGSSKVSPPPAMVTVHKNKRTPSGKSYGGLAEAVARDIEIAHRRTSSGSMRRILSGEKKMFMHPNDKIWEDPEESSTPPRIVAPAVEPQKMSSMPVHVPVHVRKNPFARVRMQAEKLERSNSEPIMTGPARHHHVEIQKNSPTQSRRPWYMSNEALSPTSSPKSNRDADEVAPKSTPTKVEQEKEIRGDDIRAATSKQRKDYSPKLPRPTVVSNKPGRPIVSFEQDWEPKEVVLEEVKAGPVGRPSKQTFSLNRSQTEPQSSAIPHIVVDEVTKLPIPTICLPDEPDLPAMGLSEEPDDLRRGPVVPSINVEPPTISVEPPTISVQTPSIHVSQPSSAQARSARPKGQQPHSPSRPLPHHAATSPLPKSTPHYTPSVRQSGALCAHCALPIAGRILSAAGERFHPGCFVCHQCHTNLELVAFYAEPENRRSERLERIAIRRSGDQLALPEGTTPEEAFDLEVADGDPSLRFYCHLDFHELFSPRCKSCKTPIEGEVIVACGAEWHAGHFFCAQCGDPFDSSTPFVEKDGYAWCVGCHTNRYSSKCRKCKKPIVDTVVKALGYDWHGGCFVCMECNGEFEDGRYFLRGDSQDPVCVKCEERRLKA